MANYGSLPKVWVIFITSYDPFGAGRMVYTVRRRCEELPELDYDDGDVTLYLFVNGKPEDDTPGNLVQLLHFMGETNWENACNPSLKKLMEYVEELKRDPEVKEAYMHWDVYIQAERDDAREEGREEERVNTRLEAARADAAESRASAAEEELARTKAALAALEKKYKQGA
jgi:predicted transposase/invertase (TIGR01784 family)